MPTSPHSSPNAPPVCARRISGSILTTAGSLIGMMIANAMSGSRSRQFSSPLRRGGFRVSSLRSIRRIMIEPKARGAVEGLRRGGSAPFKSAINRKSYVAALRVARQKEMAR